MFSGKNHSAWRGGKTARIICNICKKPFYDWKAYKKRRITCSKKCLNSLISIKYTGEKSFHWKGGKINLRGYVLIRSPKHPRANNGYVGEHILKMEKHLKRFLKKGEVVHHKNEIKNDNRIKNLQLFKSDTEHMLEHVRLRKLKGIKNTNQFSHINL